MIEFALVEPGTDPTDPGNRTTWGTVADGEIASVDESLTDPVSGGTFADFVAHEKSAVEGITDPVDVSRRFDEPPIVAGVPRADGDGLLLADDADRFGEEGDLAPFERFEYDQYPDGTRTGGTTTGRAARRDHVVPERFTVVEFSRFRDGGLEAVGRVDTDRQAIVETAVDETTLRRILAEEFRPLSACVDPVELVDRFSGKTSRQVAVVDAVTGTLVANPREILPKPNHPEHASVDLLENPPEPYGDG